MGGAGTVLYHDGTNWSTTNVGTAELLQEVWASSDADVWVVGQGGGIYHWDGATWAAIASGVGWLSSAWGSSASDVWFGSSAAVLHWDGFSLTRQSFSEAFVFDIHGAGPSNVIAAGSAASIGMYDGTEWKLQTHPAQPTSPTLRIGEYNGISAGGVVAVATWTGNTLDLSGDPLDQQSFFDGFTFDWQVGAEVLTPTSSIVLLEPGAPNPFRWVTRIAYSLPSRAEVRLSIHDVGGRLVRELDAGGRSPGRHQVTWDGRDVSGRSVATGVYLLRLEAGGRTHTRKLALAR